ncbi:hypothetical protein PICMEDRAFT_71508 [Pichia membranifaciens NRRL Y-2026]|uniref:1,3-beta-glucanosyltransferase n=1 Tax=Pichia membranifaciens NRRL Y-2026 TaxID=763406 RepID=A0A1E3NMW7_9ASCO|nr:hypothetical protein PICMEDRAFT_71508 [Pichia membranifaciens NRRL Y-2026]ODQ47436.1 hypothetical protein PICMEDRAFT_71508 [Pichia membranifaciens NRRL Y-2026]
MKFTSTLTAAISSLLFAGISHAADFPTVEVVGNKFFYSNNGSQFYIRGVAYQQNTANLSSDASYVDPLIDEDACKRDIPYLTQLNTNVLRIYALNATGNHDACMEALQDAGIYVIADLSAPKESIITDNPEWTTELYERYTSVIDMMQGYDNVLGFFAGNEVVTNSTNSDSAPFVKAAIRDMKAYISDKGYRDIPVGYSANDDSHTRASSADFFACGENDVKADFYGINMYEWCGDASFSSSGYEDRTKEFSNLTIPIFFSEYGCNSEHPRKFTEVGTLFSDKMTDVWSGGIVYMYFEEENNYGLISLKGNSVSTLGDFTNLKSEMNAIHPSSATVSQASASAHQLKCPVTGGNWIAATALPPTPEQDVCDCISKASLCVVDDDVDDDDYADLFGTVCNYISCDDINADGSEGDYGPYSFCSSKEKLNYVLNKYYEDQGKKSSACDFSGSATVVSASSASTCSSVLKNASASGGASGGGKSKQATATSDGQTGKSTKTAKKDDSSKDESSSQTSAVSSISSSSKAGASGLETPFRSLGLSSAYIVTLVASVTLGGITMILV